MANQRKSGKMPNWPKIAGILNMIAGVIFCLVGLGLSLAANRLTSTIGWQAAYQIIAVSSVGAMLGIMALVGGIQATKRKGWGLALAGTIGNLLLGLVGLPLAGIIDNLSVLIFLGIPAIMSLFAGKNQFEREEAWMSSVGGVLNLAAGTGGIIVGFAIATTRHAVASYYGWSYAIPGVVATLTIVLGLAAIAGGVCALMRRQWTLALVGSICSILLVVPVGIPATVFVASGKSEFETKSSYTV